MLESVDGFLPRLFSSLRWPSTFSFPSTPLLDDERRIVKRMGGAQVRTTDDSGKGVLGIILFSPPFGLDVEGRTWCVQFVVYMSV